MRLAYRAHLAWSFQYGPPNFVTFNLGSILTYSIDLICLAFVVNEGKCQHNWRTSIAWHPRVPIFVEHWGGIICYFVPILTDFQQWGGMNLDHDNFQVSKLSEDQKKSSSPNIEELFSRNLSEDQNKKSSPKIEEFFPRNLVKTTKKVLTSSSAQMQTTAKPELGTCAATISLAIALEPYLFLNSCVASILAILSAIAQAQFKYAYD